MSIHVPPTGDVPGFRSSDGLEFVGYHDLDGHPAFKMAIYPHGDRWLMYVGHFWRPAWSVLDITDPAKPELLNTFEGPDNTWTLQIQAADGLLVTALEQIGGPFDHRGKLWGRDLDKPHEEGVLFWSLEDPLNPRQLSRFSTGGTGTHRNFYSGGDRAYLAANMAGYTGNILVIVDVSDPTQPVEVGRWHAPGQWHAAGESTEHHAFFHGPVYLVDDLAYAPFGRAGVAVLDLSDENAPKRIGKVDIGDFGSVIGVHSVLPLPERGIAIASTEAILEDEPDPANLVFTIDISDPSKPKPLAVFPTPVPPEEMGIGDFNDLGGKFGPHNLHLPHGQAHLAHVDDRIHITYESGGLWVYDITNPLLPVPVDHFIPDTPAERRGHLPEELETQTEDVIIDARGYVYISDKNHGIFVLRDRKMANPTG